MRIVSENSDADIERHRAAEVVSSTLRELTANLMRVSRGAGKPWLIGKHASDLIAAMTNFREAVGMWPGSEELTAMLDVSTPLPPDSSIADVQTRHVAGDIILRGCLQVAASRLIGQRTQETAGDSQMFDGILMIDKMREAARKETRSLARAARKSAVKPTTRRRSGLKK